jgi:hypothetical protein
MNLLKSLLLLTVVYSTVFANQKSLSELSTQNRKASDSPTRKVLISVVQNELNTNVESLRLEKNITDLFPARRYKTSLTKIYTPRPTIHHLHSLDEHNAEILISVYQKTEPVISQPGQKGNTVSSSATLFLINLKTNERIDSLIIEPSLFNAYNAPKAIKDANRNLHGQITNGVRRFVRRLDRQ